MDLVSTSDEIVANLLLLNDYLRRPDTHRWAVELIRQGIHFVAYDSGSGWLLGPSRFVGYVGNTREKHEKNEDKHGSETDRAIQQVLGKHSENNELEGAYKQVCDRHGVEETRKQRKYWVIR